MGKARSRGWKFYSASEEEGLRLLEFIEPKSHTFSQVLARAKALMPEITQRCCGEAFAGELCGYVPPSRWTQKPEDGGLGRTVAEWVDCEVEVIYEALRPLPYAVEKKGGVPGEQGIRTYEELLNEKGLGGTCLDLVLLMAGCLEAIGLHPLVVIIDNPPHAVLGYWSAERGFGPRTPKDEVQPLFSSLGELKAYQNRLKQRYPWLQLEFKFLECTDLSPNENKDFKEAQKHGEEWSKEPIRFVLDVEAGRLLALRRQLQDYLNRVREDALALPPAFGFPPDVDFQTMRMPVKVRKGPRRFSEAEARAREIARRQGLAEEEPGVEVYQRYPWRSLEEESEAERPRDWDREMRGKLKRAVILGDPGFGKTWLLKHEALRLANKALERMRLSEQYPLDLDGIEVPVFLSLAQLATYMGKRRRPIPLEKAVFVALQARYPLGKELKEWMADNLDSERIVFLFDALDEVLPEGRQEELCQCLNNFATKYTRARILLTSRLVGYPGSPIPLPEDGELELLPFDRRQQRAFVRAWFSGQPEKGETFLQRLRENPQLQGLAQVPLLLALMCWLFDERGELPRNRAALYEACLWGILTRSWKECKEGKAPRPDNAYLDAKLELAEEVALTLFLEGKELFSLRDVRSAIQKAFKERPELTEELGKGVTALVREFEKDGFLIKAGAGLNPPYLFLHLTFQEYLAACALARRAAAQDGEKDPEWLRLVKPRLFDPHWEEVVGLLASRLKDATPLILMIWQEPEDIFLDRLHLVGKCLVDAQYIHEELRTDITREILALLWRAIQENLHDWLIPSQENEPQFKNLLRCVEITAKAFQDVLQELITPPVSSLSHIRALGNTRCERVVPKLLDLLENPDPRVRETAVRALGKIGSEEAVPKLIELLQDPDPGVSHAAVRALGKIGSEEAMLKLIELLQDPSPAIRKTVVQTLGEMGSEEAVPKLTKLLGDPDPGVSYAAARVLGKIGGKEVWLKLIELLQDPNPDVRKTMVRILAMNKSKEAVIQLTDLLQDPDPYVSYTAAWALGKIGSEEAVPKLIDRIQKPMASSRWIAAWAFGKIGTEKATAKLIELLNDTDSQVQRVAAWALGMIASEEAVPKLIDLLQNHDPYVRCTAAWALGKICGEEAVKKLSELFEDPDPEIRQATAEVLSEIRDEEFLPNLAKCFGEFAPDVAWEIAHVLERVVRKGKAVPRLSELLQNPDRDARWIAAKILGKLRSDKALPKLIELLQDPDLSIREEAIKALERIGNEEVVPQLYSLLRDSNPAIKRSAARALRTISRRQGLRILLDGSWVKVH